LLIAAFLRFGEKRQKEFMASRTVNLFFSGRVKATDRIHKPGQLVSRANGIYLPVTHHKAYDILLLFS